MQSNQCITCKHYEGANSRTSKITCAAFPGGIPYEIISGQHDHKEAFKGDNGIRFEKVRIKAGG